MTKEAIQKLVENETGVTLCKDSKKPKTTQTFARYVAIMLLTEEGYGPTQIEELDFITRGGVYYALQSANSLILTNKEFKKMYLTCAKRLEDMEDAA